MGRVEGAKRPRDMGQGMEGRRGMDDTSIEIRRRGSGRERESHDQRRC